MDTFTKQLLSCSQLGIEISVADGHRWITANESIHGFNLEEAYFEKTGKYFNNKVYGSIYDALKRVDEILNESGRPTLLEYFEQTGLGEQFLV
jgi:hypothetical protein